MLFRSMDVPIKITARRPKHTQKVRGGTAALDGRVDFYEIAPSINDINPENVQLYIEPDGTKQDPINQTELYLKTLVQGNPPAFVHQNMRISSNV